ncbi:MAG: ATP synthase F1 subunit delta [Oscillospiraceae bacterium]
MREFSSSYASALIKLAIETDSLDEIFEQIMIIKEEIISNPNFIKILDAPMIAVEDKLSVADETFKGKINVYLLNFIKILVEKGAMHEFVNCANAFEKLYNEDKNIEKVTAVTAIPLNEKLTEKLIKKLETVTGKTIVLVNQVDPECMGGIVLRLENSQIDGSIKTKLEAIKTQMFSIIA